VFASADEVNMQKLVDAGAVGGEPVVFARNLLEIIVEPGNPMGITGVADLARDDLAVITCAPEVPCGRYAAEVFEKAGVTVAVRSLEENVKAVVSKVTLGEADAGIVYRTDVTAAGDRADGVPIPEDLNVVATYPVAVTREAPNSAVAEAFVAFVRSPQAQAILASYGFLPA
jgi:molybdate transport system substrate-binding protein